MFTPTGRKNYKILVSALLAMLTAWTLVLPVALAAQEVETTAIVAFTDGTLEWIPPVLGGEDGDGMNLDFDTHSLPAGEIKYNSVNGPHLLRVDDSRDTTTGWQVTAKISVFTNTSTTSNTFSGTVRLETPATTPVPGPTVNDPILLISGAMPTDIMTAQAALGRGEYKTTWESENTRLIISQPESLNLTLASYEATITWTLTVQP